MTESLTGKVAVITGASAGLGLAIAHTFRNAGASLVIAGRRAEPLEAAAAELGADTLAVVADVGREEQVEQLFSRTVAEFGSVDILVNNAGFGVEARIDEMSLEQWQSVIDTNLTGAFLCARAAFRQMLTQDGGRIINIGSISAHVPRANGSAYAASKFALDGLTRAWQLEGRDHGIAVSILHPGGVQTSFQGGPTAAQLGFNMMPADEVARGVLLMATLPPDITLLDATMVPINQPYLGRG